VQLKRPAHLPRRTQEKHPKSAKRAKKVGEIPKKETAA
jgi:hypothetical protein